MVITVISTAGVQNKPGKPRLGAECCVCSRTGQGPIAVVSRGCFTFTAQQEHSSLQISATGWEMPADGGLSTELRPLGSQQSFEVTKPHFQNHNKQPKSSHPPPKLKGGRQGWVERLQLSRHAAQGHSIYQHRPFHPSDAVLHTKPRQHPPLRLP